MPHEPLTPESIIDLRRRLGLNQTAFAALLNERVPGLRVDQVAVSRWENGRVKPSGVVAHLLAALEREKLMTEHPPANSDD